MGITLSGTRNQNSAEAIKYYDLEWSRGKIDWKQTTWFLISICRESSFVEVNVADRSYDISYRSWMYCTWSTSTRIYVAQSDASICIRRIQIFSAVAENRQPNCDWKSQNFCNRSSKKSIRSQNHGSCSWQLYLLQYVERFLNWVNVLGREKSVGVKF